MWGKYQYCEGSSVLWRDSFSTVSSQETVTVPVTTPYNVSSVLWRLSSTLEVVQYIGGIRITLVLWGIASVLRGNSFSTVEVVQYSGGITSVHVGEISVL